MKKARSFFTLFLTLFHLLSIAQTYTNDVREFVTKTYIHGIPYKEARAFGPKAISKLVIMLNDPMYEDHRPNIISVLGMIGNPSAIKPLKIYLYNQKGEISYSTFISVLAIFQALGYIAQSGNQEAMKMLVEWSNPNYWSKSGLHFSYKNYKGPLMGSSINNLAIQGLGISGRPEALQVLEGMNSDSNQRSMSTLSNSVKSAIKLNKRVKNEGPIEVFGKEGLQ